jgi:GNAT superfamily N-acetyltransferase
MVEEKQIQIIEKPDWVSWDEIHEVIWKAHEKNRERGINMAHASMSGDEIRELLSDDAKMFVALCDNHVIGTAAFKEKEVRFWFGKDRFAYCCFASLLPEFMGKGVYYQFVKKREESARSMGLDKMMFNTHPDNTRVLQVAKQNGFKAVKYVVSKGAQWVYMVKWLNGCPYSDFRCGYEYYKQLLRTNLKRITNSKEL